MIEIVPKEQLDTEVGTVEGRSFERDRGDLI
jgi:hypothetical protein